MSIKPLPILFLVLNVTLAGILLIRTAPQSFPEKPAVPARELSSERARNEAASFSWSQIESSDYAAYAQNLRKVGCPERTIRILVSAELEDGFQEKQKELETALGKNSLALDEKLATLRKEKEEKLRQALGGESQTSGITYASPVAVAPASVSEQSPVISQSTENAPPSDSSNAQTRPQATIPLAFLIPDSGTPLTKNQQAQIQNIQQAFVSAVNAVSQNPADPAYLAAWMTAQEQADEQYKLQFGTQAFLQHQLHAFISSKTPQKPN